MPKRARASERAIECAYLALLQHVLLVDMLQNGLDTRLLHLAGHDELVQDEVGLIEAIDDVELAHVLKVSIERQHVFVDGLEDDQLVVALVAAKHKVQARVTAHREKEEEVSEMTHGGSQPHSGGVGTVCTRP